MRSQRQCAGQVRLWSSISAAIPKPRGFARSQAPNAPFCRTPGTTECLASCAVGTPVIVHARGLLGHLVRRHGLGRAVDCRDPGALRHAMLELTGETVSARYVEPLARFASRYSREHFEQALLGVFRDGEETRASALAGSLAGSTATQE